MQPAFCHEVWFSIYFSPSSSVVHSGTSSSPPSAYSPAVLVQIPVKRLLQHAWQHQEAYSTLYPSLLRLTTTHLPQLCLVEDWLKEEEIGKGELAWRVPQYKTELLREMTYTVLSHTLCHSYTSVC